MNMRMNEKGRQTKLLAAIAVLAMVVCAFAVIVPSEEADGAVGTTTVSNIVTAEPTTGTAYEVLNAGKYYIPATITAVTIDNGITSDVNLYLADNSDSASGLSITDNRTSKAINVYVATGAPVSGVLNAVAGLVLKETTNDLTGVVADVGANNSYASIKTGTAVTGSGTLWGISVQTTGSAYTYYAQGSTTTTSIGSSETVNISNGTATVNGVDSNGITINTVKVINAQSVDSSSITVTGGSGGALTISGSASSTGATLEMVKGKATNSATLTGATLKYVAGASTTVYATIGDAENSNETSITLNGSYSEDIEAWTVLTTITVATGSYYKGTVTQVFTDTNTYTQSVSLVVDGNGTTNNGTVSFNDKTGITVTGEAEKIGADGDMMIGSTVTITGAESSGVDNDDESVAALGITVSDVALTSMDLGAPLNITKEKSAVVLDGQTLTFTAGGKITLANGSETTKTTNLFIMGTLRSEISPSGQIAMDGANTNVYAKNTSEANLYVTGGGDLIPITTTVLSFDLDTDMSALLKALKESETGMVFEIYSDKGTTTAFTLTGAYNLSGISIYFTGDHPITMNIGDGTAGAVIPASVTLNDVKINRDIAPTEGIVLSKNMVDGSQIIVSTGSSLSIVNSTSLYVEVIKQSDGASITVDNPDVIYENTTNNVKVGYGTTLTLTGSGSTVMDVFGELIINTSASVPTEMTVYQGGSVIVNGSLSIDGTATFSQNSTGVVNGTVTVGQYTKGGAILNVLGDFTVAAEGVLNVSAVEPTNYLYNQLNAPAIAYNSGYASKFVVLGTMNMNGQMSGIVHDQGTITFNGYADAVDTNNDQTDDLNATIVIYDGVGITVTSVSGTLAITDRGVSDDLIVDQSIMESSDGNIVELTNVKNVTVSETVNQLNYTVGKVNHRDYQSVMYLSGTVSSSGDGNIEIVSADLAEVGKDDVTGYVTVASDAELNFGANVSLEVNNPLVVDGSISYIKATLNDDKVAMTGTGPITVDGVMTVTSGYMKVSVVNAAMYSNTVTDVITTVTQTYTNFVDAIGAAPEADGDLVTVMGTVTAGSVEIPAGVYVNMANSAGMIVSSDSEVILKNGASFTGNASNWIEVEGTFTAENRSVDLKLGDDYIAADVVIVNDPAKTWTSFGNALEIEDLDTIVLNRDIRITEDTTIPSDKTVTTVYSIYVYNDALLTVDGTLAMTPGTGKLLSLANPDDAEDTGDLEVNGVVSVKYLASEQNLSAAALSGTDGVFFIVQESAFRTAYLSNMDFAAETASAYSSKLVNLSAGENQYNVQVIGTVGAADVTFAAAENSSIIIAINGNYEGNILSMGTLTMSGDVSLVVSVQGQFTGIVKAPYGIASDTATVSFEEAGSFSIFAGHQISVDGNDCYVALEGNVTGGIAVMAGTVQVLSGDVLAITDDANMTVVSGSTVIVAGTLQLGDMNRGLWIVPMTVEGALNIEGTLGIVNGTTDSRMEVPGTLIMENRNASIPAAIDVYVTGTMQVGEGDTLTVNGKIVIGTPANSLGAAGVLSGNINLVSNRASYIIAYAGSDVSGAKMNWNAALDKSMAKSTTYYVNGMQYATVYAYGTLAVEDVFIGDDVIDIIGYTTNNNWYSSAEDAEIKGTKINESPIGRYANVYAEFELAEVPGIISKDAGIILTIDGNVITNNGGMGGTGDSSFTTSLKLSVGTHTIAWSERSGYTFADVTVTFNGVEVENGGTITITPDMQSYTIVVSGSEPSVAATGGDDGLGLTDYLLIILVVLIVVMAIMVALRLMRS